MDATTTTRTQAERAARDAIPDHPQLAGALRAGDLPAVAAGAGDLSPRDLAETLARCDEADAGVLFRLLDKDTAAAAFEELDAVTAQRVLDGMREDRVAELVEGLDPDDRARLLGEMPASVAHRVLAGLAPDRRRATAALLGYPAGSAGRLMTPETVSLHSGGTVTEALARVRRAGRNAETVYTLPVVGPGRVLEGVVTLRELVLGTPETPLADLVETGTPTVRATDTGEHAARLLGDSDRIALPVVDGEDRLLGLLTIDDAVEELERADSEDVARQSGAAPWSGHYMTVGVLSLARSRIVWLLLLLVAATLTVNVLQYFEDTLAQVTTLALFVPLLIGTGGNAGAQAATASVRALAVGEVRPSDVLTVMWSEARVGAALGTMLALAGLVIGTALVGAQVALVVGISLVAICAWAATIGATMPLVARRLGIDPAVVSAPAVTTLVDATGLVIYFSVAHLVLQF
ncbi:Mg/Co/Ni transporter MgtE / CBS domain [Pseudonocardia sp. Ae168_Ps1]|uniref:magnesium transporter n=1 Tax=unclassified Pseudonocardia TaxID=2619320 RepID=UPI00094B1292|nr:MULTISPECIES: magnesium transporter [unclassified Pseudonocardia]OLL71407.1 Mg/Co/Ni transporter MgtE / CBS domain [Pseudonocardia sp. Ae168_Ps1]OLL77046.1 Mg/Co/Ni transporter MgtE / CBS domain [Pseudonocardia sp. Ae150A_Ps1]OLL88843.1 Mg/Co/Ni transporter MgtE / CBS domain [Pseudonocardia sp. Ae263_Ps1]OLL91131.1 Mg/Co/Ni transporter MgtE / CBS domain [Pseudonocardia sp. Ae356_Ps1]